MTADLFLNLAGTGYLLASVFYCAYVLKTQRFKQIMFLHAGRLAGVIGVVCHTTSIGLHCLQTDHTPISNAPEAFSATGWAIAITFLCLEAINWKTPPSVIGAAAYPLAFLLVFTGSTMSATRRKLSITHIHLLDSSLVSLHILAIVFAFGLLTLAGVCSIIYLIQHRLLKQKKFIAGALSKLPPLTTVDHLAFSLVCLAFPLLSLGILAGIIRAALSTTPIGLLATDIPTIASFVCWGFYGLYLWAHATATWQGLKANYLLLIGLAIALLTFFAPSSLHRFS
jgi:ABC-type uncharacterized transport system permease subunit